MHTYNSSTTLLPMAQRCLLLHKGLTRHLQGRLLVSNRFMTDVANQQAAGGSSAALGKDLELSSRCCTPQHFKVSRDGRNALIGGATTDVRLVCLHVITIKNMLRLIGCLGRLFCMHGSQHNPACKTQNSNGSFCRCTFCVHSSATSAQISEPVRASLQFESRWLHPLL